MAFVVPDNELKMDLYGILGVEPTASDDAIKRAYRRLARELHPDKTAGDANKAEQFKQVNNAKSILTDAKKRKYYDSHRTRSSYSRMNTAAGNSSSKSSSTSASNHGGHSPPKPNNSSYTRNTQESDWWQHFNTQQQQWSYHHDYYHHHREQQQKKHSRSGSSQHHSSSSSKNPPRGFGGSSQERSESWGTSSSRYQQQQQQQQQRRPKSHGENDGSSSFGHKGHQRQQQQQQKESAQGGTSKSSQKAGGGGPNARSESPPIFVFGFTQETKPCKNCLKQFTFCHQHTYQRKMPEYKELRRAYVANPDEFCRAADSSKQDKSQHGRSQSQRPSSSSSSNQRHFGVTQNGLPCKICIKKGGYCHLHYEQDPLFARSSSSSSYAPPKRPAANQYSSSTGKGSQVYGVCQNGEPCKRCLKKCGFCHQHEWQQTNSRRKQHYGQ
mmetsp:Transcript_1182/g.3298  ORF Transcript_1182/g.3298 Transcript_1182/m.3298 type:complete len:440 (+) Transcript_1182:90-1409(+)